VKDKLDSAGTSGRENDLVEIIENVTSFKLIPFEIEGKDANAKIKRITSNAPLKTPPYLLEIEISVLDSQDSFTKWSTAGSDEDKKEIEAESGYTFRRAILFGDRRSGR
jgi:hypothetical protein